VFAAEKGRLLEQQNKSAIVILCDSVQP